MANNPVIELVCSYDFCSAHKLARDDWNEAQNRSVFGKCATLHGHTYRLEVVLEGKIPGDSGMLINGFDADRIVREKIVQKADHQYLNEAIPFFKTHLPTAEWIAFWVFEELKEAFPAGCSLKKIRVFETPTLYAEYGGTY